MTNSNTVRRSFQAIVILTILLSTSFLHICQGISALQTEDANRSSIASLNGSSSMTNETMQEATNRSLLLQGPSEAPRLEPGTVAKNKNILTPGLVAEELKALSPVQVADYPLHELSSDDIVATLNLLSDTEIQKVLGNTKPENLQIIFTKIPEGLHELFLNRLDSGTKSYVLNSIGRGTMLP